MDEIETIDILLLGAGGREHALLRKLLESPRAGKVWAAPGNGGILAEAELADIDQENPAEVARFAAEHGVGLVVIGPEAPLVAGVASALWTGERFSGGKLVSAAVVLAGLALARLGAPRKTPAESRG